jgi:N-acetylmuramoyl-L-alanine amidase
MPSAPGTRKITHLQGGPGLPRGCASPALRHRTDRSSGVPTNYKVKQGDHLSEIAYRHGFRDFHTVWDDGANADLKARRVNPNVLHPGDIVVIPDKQRREHPSATDKGHRFVTVVPKLRLRVRLRDVNGDPLANTECELLVDGKKKKLTTDGDGRIDEAIPITADGGMLIIQGEQYQLKIGDLDPIDEPSGQRARLANLGYYFGSQDDVDPVELRTAVEEFQCDHGLAVDGDCGPNTQAKLLELHGC